jgi:hypothetical protein
MCHWGSILVAADRGDVCLLIASGVLDLEAVAATVGLARVYFRQGPDGVSPHAA